MDRRKAGEMGRHREYSTPQLEQPVGEETPMRQYRLQPYHREIARLMVQGHSHSEIARLMGMTPGSITRISKNPMFIAMYEQMAQLADFQAVDVMDRVRAIVPRALDIIQEFFANAEDGDGVDPVKRVDKCFDLLKMAHSELREPKGGSGVHIHDSNVQFVEKPPGEMDDRELDESIETLLTEGE